MELWLLTALLVIGALVLLGFVAKRRRTARRGREQRVFIEGTLAASRADRAKRLIVSFSSLPDRIQQLTPTIRCLLEQTRPPDEIVLALPAFSLRQNCAYFVPQYLSEFPRLRILHCEKDWGPATKFIPVIQEEKRAGREETLVMVVDDDRVYPRDAVETFLHYHAQLPEAALCFRGGPMPRSLDWRDSRLFFANEIREPKRVAVMSGCGSYLLQPRFFDEALWDYSDAPQGAFYMDDIWISGSLDRRGVEKYVVPASGLMRSVVQQMGTMTLHDVPRGRRENNNEAIAYFRETWNVFPAR